MHTPTVCICSCYVLWMWVIWHWPSGIFFSPSVLVWPILAFGNVQLFRFPNICVVVGGYANLCRTGPADTDCGYDTGPCFSVSPLPVVCLHRCRPQSFSPLWKLDPTQAKNAAYVHCQPLWICPSTSLRWHHDSSYSLFNLPNNYLHILLFSTDQTLMKCLTWTSEWLHYLCGSLQSGKQREVGESIFFFQVVCVSRWDGITAQNQGPTGECGVWGTYGETGCWWAAYTSFS